jgi:predicted ATP-dependent endonuclease of OLD family
MASHPGQVIFASHSAELVAEAPPKAVVWVDRTRRSGVISPDAKTLEDLTVALGSGFNLRLARVLRARCVLFVEGEDMSILRVLARTLGLAGLVSEATIAVVPLGGAASRSRLESFAWIADELLKGAVRGFVVLDRDYRSADVVSRIEQQMHAFGLYPHVWRRKELESYLLETPVLARATGGTEDWIDGVLDKETERLRNFIQSRMTGAMHQDRVDRKLDVTTVAELVAAELDTFWNDAVQRRRRAPAKELISAINREAQSRGLKTIDAHTLAVKMRADEIDEEMRRVLNDLDPQSAT